MRRGSCKKRLKGLDWGEVGRKAPDQRALRALVGPGKELGTRQARVGEEELMAR